MQLLVWSFYKKNPAPFIHLFYFILTGTADSLGTKTFLAATLAGNKFWNQTEQGKNNYDNTCDHRYGRCFYFRIIVDPAHYYRKQTETEGDVFHAHNQLLSKKYGLTGLVYSKRGQNLFVLFVNATLAMRTILAA